MPGTLWDTLQKCAGMLARGNCYMYVTMHEFVGSDAIDRLHQKDIGMTPMPTKAVANQFCKAAKQQVC